MAAFWKRELSIAAILIAFGIVLLPIAVYMVGQPVFGPYEGDGLTGLLDHFWLDLVSGSAAPWLLALSPYLVILLLRLGHRLARGPGREPRHNSDS